MRDIPFKCFGSREIGAASVGVQVEMDLATRYLMQMRTCFQLDGYKDDLVDSLYVHNWIIPRDWRIWMRRPT